LQALNFFNGLLTSELRLRKKQLHGSMKEQRRRLKECLMIEQRLEMIAQAVSRDTEGREAALILISQAIPCIMHLENRVGEKLITVILAMAVERFHQERNIKSLSKFAVNISLIVNTKVLGTLVCPEQWKVPINERLEMQ
jgi:hypothetical protein